jgi:ATP-dependent 26S proteasome regulatory subunit
LAYLDYSQVIESHLGDTGKNVGKAMKFAQQMPLVLFLDECDSLVGQRTGGAASGCEKEENRAVNQVLLELDALAGRSIVIFATNLPDSLDPALVRRIAIRLELPSPTAKQRARFVRQLRSQWTFLDEGQLIDAAKDKHSFAEIEQVVHDAVRRTVVEAERQRLQKCSA